MTVFFLVLGMLQRTTLLRGICQKMGCVPSLSMFTLPVISNYYYSSKVIILLIYIFEASSVSVFGNFLDEQAGYQ